VPFPFGFDLSQVMKFLASEGPLNWELTRQVGNWVATAGEPDPGVDPAAEAQLRDLARAAQTHVSTAIGLAETLSPQVRAVSRTSWVELNGEALRPVLEQLAVTLQAAQPTAGDPDEGDPFGGLLAALAPMMLGVQSGFMLGYLAQNLLGQHDLPLPVTPDPGLVFIVANIDEFEAEWSLPRDELRFHVALHEVIHAAVLAVPWVGARLHALGLEYVRTFQVDPSVLDERFGAFDPADPSSLEGFLDDPGALLGAMESPEQREVLGRLQAFTSIFEGYADQVLARVGRPLITEYSRIEEAMHRHRVERGEAQRFIEKLLGLELTREQYERGDAFCRGVVERAGPDALNRLWDRPEMFPTPSELDAPGLWLARLEVME
jgi:putative hydrolase